MSDYVTSSQMKWRGVLQVNIDHLAVACKALAAGVRRAARLSVDEWADRYRRLPQKGASEPGPWRTARTPYLREIMRVLSVDHPARRVVFMKSSQVGGTEAGNNWIGYIIDHAPAPMMCVQPTGKTVERWSKQRLAAMIDETPALRERMGPARSRTSGNTIDLKEFPGGVLAIASAESPSDLRSMPAKYLFCDEVDAYPQDIDGEGDPVSLAERRTTTFPRRKIFLVSTPTIKGASRIESEWQASDQRRYFVPCPHCQHRQHLQWSNLQWPDGRPEETTYACEACGVCIEEHHKTSMLEQGEWRATSSDTNSVGFHINALYTPIGLGDTWADHARDWQRRQGDPSMLKVFINTVLGETWEDRRGALEPESLKQRAESYPLRTVPAGCLVLTLGVDVQKDRLACQLVGWGKGETAWILDWVELTGDPDREEVWDALTQLRKSPLLNAYGQEIRVSMTAIDSGGHHTHKVYWYARLNRNDRVIAIKGASTPNRPVLGKPSKQDVNWRGQILPSGVDLWLVGSDSGKHALLARLEGDAERGEHERRLHFSAELPEDYYAQLTAEIFDVTKNRWVKLTGRRNEGMDTFVYAMAASHHPLLRVHMMRDGDWDRLALRLEVKQQQPSLFDEPQSEDPSQQKAITPAAAPSFAVRPRGGFVTGWKK